MKIFWLAVHETPYNSYLFKQLCIKWDIDIIYEKRHVKNLDFKNESNTLLDWVRFKNLLITKDIVIITGWNAVSKTILIALRGVFNRPTILWTDTVKENVYTKSILNLSKRYLLSRLDAIWTTGDIGVERMRASYILPKKVNVYSLPFFVEIPSEHKKTVSIDGELNLLMINRLIPRKGIEDAFLVLNNLKKKGWKISLKIAGKGPLEDAMKAMVMDLNLESEVELLGWLCRDEILRHMLASDYLLHLPNRIDPFPLVVLESLAAGLPVISNALAGSAVDRIKNGVNGLLVPSEVSDIVDTLTHEQIQLESKKYDLQQNARQLSANWDGKKARSMFQELLSNIYDFN